MNAILQHRGHILMGAGHSIAVQNFNENLSILVMLSVYAVLMALDFSIYTVVVIFGLFVSFTMVVIRQRLPAQPAQGLLPPIPTDAAAAQTGSNLSRFTFSMLVPSMRISRVGPVRVGEWRSPSL